MSVCVLPARLAIPSLWSWSERIVLVSCRHSRRYSRSELVDHTDRHQHIPFSVARAHPFPNLEALRAVIGSYGGKNVISPVSPSPPPALCIINLLGLVEKRKLLLHFTAGGLVSVLWRRRLESMEGMELGCRSMNERAATPLLLWTALPDRRE